MLSKRAVGAVGRPTAFSASEPTVRQLFSTLVGRPMDFERPTDLRPTLVSGFGILHKYDRTSDRYDMRPTGASDSFRTSVPLLERPRALLLGFVNLCRTSDSFLSAVRQQLHIFASFD